MSIRVVLADDHILVRQGVRALLEREGIQVVGEASDGQEAQRLVLHENPDAAVMDISMPNFNGLDAALGLSRSSPRTRLILLTRHNEEQYVAEALRCGVRGYVLKDQAANDLVRAIREVCSGQVYLSPGVSRAVVEAYATPDRPRDALSARERQANGAIARRRIIRSPRRSKVSPSDASAPCTGARSPGRDSRPGATRLDPNRVHGAQPVFARPAADVLAELLSPGHRMDVS